MPEDTNGVTLHEVNRNLLELRRQVEEVGRNFVPLILWEENRKNVGERMGQLERDMAEVRSDRALDHRGFQTNFFYPAILVVAAAVLSYFASHYGAPLR